MDTLISLGFVAAALIPLALLVRELVFSKGTPGATAQAMTAFFDSADTTYPSLATLKELDATAPAFVKRKEWWSE